jgi:hypothetical protein
VKSLVDRKEGRIFVADKTGSQYEYNVGYYQK